MKYTLLLSFCFMILFHFSNGKPDASKFIVWGPGLDVKIHLPVRYFYVQCVDTNGQNLTNSLDTDKIELYVTSKQHSHLRIHSQVLDRHDGSYLVRMRPHQTYHNLSLILRYNEDIVGKSPYHLKGAVYHEECDCPLNDLDEFIKTYQCQQHYDQITKDFSIFKDIDMKKAWKDMSVRFDRPRQMSVGHYVIKDNELYRETLGEYVGFKMFSDSLLTSLLRKVKMPDLDFAWNFGDWPLTEDLKLPLISWCGSDDSNDLVVPTYDITSSTLGAMHRTNLDMLSMQNHRNAKWSSKTVKAFWRGRDSSSERLKLVKLSSQYTDLIDAKLTHLFFFTNDNLTTHPSVPFRDFFNYTYQINMDGTVAGYRFPYLLAGGSLVFKQASHYYEHFYRDLVPYQHYIPLKRDISDLTEKLQWAKDNDDEAQQIAKNSYDFTLNKLLPVDIYCYHAVFFKTYASKMKSKVDVSEGMEHVPKGNDCDCSVFNKRDEL